MGLCVKIYGAPMYALRVYKSAARTSANALASRSSFSKSRILSAYFMYGLESSVSTANLDISCKMLSADTVETTASSDARSARKLSVKGDSPALCASICRSRVAELSLRGLQPSNTQLLLALHAREFHQP